MTYFEELPPEQSDGQEKELVTPAGEPQRETEPAADYAYAQPQPEESLKKEKPKWIKITETVTPILIAVTGLLASLFMCLLSIKSFGQNLMISDVVNNLNSVVDRLEAAGDSFLGMNAEVAQMFVNIYVFFAMLGGIIAGCIFAILLIVQLTKKYVFKREANVEKTSVSAVLFFFAFAVILLSMAISGTKIGSTKICIEYGDATLAGLIICGIFFAVYFIAKIAVNYESYLADRAKLFNACFNLGWVVIALIVFALLSCAPVCATSTYGGIKTTVSTGFNQICSDVMGDIVGYGDDLPQSVLDTLAKQFIFSGLGIILQIWFIFQSGKSLHAAMRGTLSAENTVKLGTQVWRLVFAVLYLIISVVLAQEQVKGTGLSISVGAPVAVLVFSVLGFAISVANKILLRKKFGKTDV
ncbi:MAG: DUF6040 family protein [Roseburia sp.]|nr:DUF6040 family protein [Roseburia sp.]